MPSYNFVCKKHKPLIEVTRIAPVPLRNLTAEQRVKLTLCPIVDRPYGEHAMERNPHPPGATVKETLDNGAMKRKIERFRDAEKLYKDRAKNGPK